MGKQRSGCYRRQDPWGFLRDRAGAEARERGVTKTMPRWGQERTADTVAAREEHL